MVAHELQRTCECGQSRPAEPLAAIGPNDAGYRGWHIGESEQLPDVAGPHQNNKIGGEPIANGPQHGQIPFHLEGQHQDEESQHEHE